MSRIILKGRGITSGVAEGEALVADQPFGFSHGVDPATGQVEDRRHPWLGRNVKDRVLVFPCGKSSTSGGLFILEMARCGNAPAAVINLDTEPVIGAGFIMAEVFYNKVVPVVDSLDRDPFQLIKDGDWVRVDADRGIVEVLG